ncbi:MAG: hypothetical protein JSR73_03815 [Proteobacteria bacterium]|nr:hypothetical protein [Pseudomonadota bacterium]
MTTGTAIAGSRLAGLALAGVLAGVLGGCVVKETRPQPKLTAVQATREIPADELLDVGVRLFDPGVPKEIEEHPEKGEKDRISPDIRKAEARYLPTLLRATLESTGQWGAVRVVPKSALLDVDVDGTIVESSGYRLSLDITVSDATGRRWFAKRYTREADTSTYREGADKSRDPFQNVYVEIANDMLAYREHLKPPELASIPRIARLRFGNDLAPAAFHDYLARQKPRDGGPEYRVLRLPAEDDPVVERVDRIRQRDQAMVDTVSDHYGVFADKLADPYLGWRRSTYDEIEQEEQIKREALTRKLLGAGAIVAGIAMPNLCSNNGSYGSYVCQSGESVVRGAAVAGGVMAVISGFEKGKQAKMHTDAIKEISGSFASEAAPAVVDVEGRTLKLTGSAEAQYAEWRRLLHELYQEETGIVATPGTPDAAGATPPPPPAKDPS